MSALTITHPRITYSTYLHECSNSEAGGPKLHPLVEYDPQAEATSLNRWGLLYKATSILIFTAYVATAVAIIILSTETSLLLPFVALLCAQPAVALSANYWKYGNQQYKGAEVALKVFEKLEALSDEAVTNRLRTWRINPGIEASKLKSIVAQFDQHIEFSQEKQQRANAPILADRIKHHLSNEAYKELVGDRELNSDFDFRPDLTLRKVANTDFARPNELEIHNVKIQAAERKYALETEAAVLKFQAAKLLKLIENPYLNDQGLSRFYCLIPLSAKTRSFVEDELDDGNAHSVVKTRNSQPTFYFKDDILHNKTTVQLAQEIFNLTEA